MEKIVKQAARHIDIIIMLVTSLFISGVAWANIQNQLTEHAFKLAEHTIQIEHVQTDIQIIKETTARTGQKVDDMANNVTEIKSWLREDRK